MLRLATAITLNLFVFQTALAATIIELIDNDGSESRVMTDGKKARLEMGGGQEYLIIDYEKKTMMSVDTEGRQVIDMSGDMPSMDGSAAPAIKIDFIANGSGPVIASYATKKYTIKVNGQECGTVFGSQDAKNLSGLNELMNAMKSLAEKQRAMMGGYAGMVDDCTRANMDFISNGETVGLPMRMVDNNGKEKSEIKAIHTNVTLPANAFTIPPDYKVITLADQLKQAQQGISKSREQMQQQMPQMEQMMQQMQQSGQLPPEAIEQMKRYQEMMQQQ